MAGSSKGSSSSRRSGGGSSRGSGKGQRGSSSGSKGRSSGASRSSTSGGGSRSGGAKGRSGGDRSRSGSGRPSGKGKGAGKGAGKGQRGSKGAKADRTTKPPRSTTTGRRQYEDEWEMVDRPEWGGVARRGAATLSEGNATRAWRQAVNRAREEDRSGPASGSDEWIRVDEVRDEASDAVARGESPRRAARSSRSSPDADLHPDAVDDVSRAVGAKAAPKFEKRLKDAARAFQRERWTDARRMLKSLSEQAPNSPAVRELYGLTFYRTEKWREAVRELEAFRMLTGSAEQDAVLADCYRALGRYDEVERLWAELRAASPDADTVTEGRIVSAGALADQGDLTRAIARLEEGRWRLPKAPKQHHVRRAYALADLLESAGELPRARDLFERVDQVDEGLTDARSRARALR